VSAVGRYGTIGGEHWSSTSVLRELAEMVEHFDAAGDVFRTESLMYPADPPGPYDTTAEAALEV
jgi:hypothetical protein